MSESLAILFAEISDLRTALKEAKAGLKDMAEHGYSEEVRVKAKRLIALIDKKLSS